MSHGRSRLCVLVIGSTLITLVVHDQVREDRDVISYEWLRRCADLKRGTGVLPAEYLHLSSATRTAKAEVMDRYGCPRAPPSPRLMPCCSSLPMLGCCRMSQPSLVAVATALSCPFSSLSEYMRENGGHGWQHASARRPWKACSAEGLRPSFRDVYSEERLRRFFEEVSARDVEAILDRHLKIDDLEERPATTAATTQKAKAANTKCVPLPELGLVKVDKYSA